MRWILFFLPLLLLGPLTLFAQLCVYSPNAKLYTQPSSKSKVLRQLRLYQPVKEISSKKSERFAFVETADRLRGYIAKSKVKKWKPCFQALSDKKFLRSEPKQYKHTQVRPLRKGETFLQVGAEEGWLQLRAPTGQLYWLEIGQLWEASSKIRLSFEPDSI